MKEVTLPTWLAESPFVRFALVGGAGFIADSGVFVTAHYLLQFDVMLSRLLAFFCAACVTWLGNRVFTFASQSRDKWSEWGRFMVSACLSALPNFAVFTLVLQGVGENDGAPLLALVLGVLAGMVSNYWLSKHWVFQRRGARM
ncbi:GtrA family protein [Vibrio scophthalmi]|uniref:GtrA family protein n=1 Tax=Vibrio scophthalmi TaxID=45658 RepID=UPI002FF3B8ED